jgi:hypothetical protein
VTRRGSLLICDIGGQHSAVRQGVTWHGGAGRGLAGPCRARSARRGSLLISNGRQHSRSGAGWLAKVWRGCAGLGLVRNGEARYGKTRRGSLLIGDGGQRSVARQGAAGFGAAR